MCTLLRDLRFDLRTNQLNSLPIAEYSSLRTKLVAAVSNKLISSGGTISLGSGGRQLDIFVTFALPPPGDTRLGVSILRSIDGRTRTDVYVTRLAPPKSYMAQTDLPGGDTTSLSELYRSSFM